MKNITSCLSSRIRYNNLEACFLMYESYSMIESSVFEDRTALYSSSSCLRSVIDLEMVAGSFNQLAIKVGLPDIAKRKVESQTKHCQGSEHNSRHMYRYQQQRRAVQKHDQGLQCHRRLCRVYVPQRLPSYATWRFRELIYSGGLSKFELDDAPFQNEMQDFEWHCQQVVVYPQARLSLFLEPCRVDKVETCSLEMTVKKQARFARATLRAMRMFGLMPDI